VQSRRLLKLAAELCGQFQGKYMNIYSLILDYVLALPRLSDWPESRALFQKAAALEPRDWKLPMIACEAVGGTQEQAVPASAALALVQVGIILIDDLLDSDPRGEYRLIGEAQTANFASAFLAAGTQAILHAKIQPSTKLNALHSMNQMSITVALGQFLDTQNPMDEAACWRVVENKSAAFFGAALELGAWFGGAENEIAGHLESFGRLYGEMIQLHDDLNDTMAETINSDWFQGRRPLPILYAQTVDHPERERFLELSQNILAPGALREAQDILIRSGAVSYCVEHLLQRHQASRGMLDAAELVHPGQIEALAETVIAPVRKLFEKFGQVPVELVIREKPARSE
jgi:geranylgeranyl pyrophosphate synthase